MNGLDGNTYRIWVAKTERKRSLARNECRLIRVYSIKCTRKIRYEGVGVIWLGIRKKGRPLRRL